MCDYNQAIKEEFTVTANVRWIR